jgi:hypothetical protein
MESFEGIQQKEFAHLTGEIGTLGWKLVELGWTRDQVVAYVPQLLNESADTASGDPNASRKEGAHDRRHLRH